LAQVFANLLDNALKHTPSGGAITLSARQTGAWVQVSIADTGPGIAPDQLERIFERFYQTDKSRQAGTNGGVGLGLAIARQIITAHGGTIFAQNIPGSGAVFVVKIPITKLDLQDTASR
jgi:two-component system, OmpR family, sensor histidine kinase BaeS